MKLLSLFLASSSFAQDDEAAADKGYIGYDYGGYGYNSGYAQPSYGAPSYGHQGYDGYSNQGYGQGYGDYGYGKFVNEKGPDDGRKGNGLWCYRCHGRLKLDTTESVTNNAWLDCITNGAITECRGDERSCQSTERRRNDKVVEFQAMCKNPEACAYLWRRNERYKPPFHLFGDQTVNVSGGGPSFFDDECRLNASKHMSMRSQWESTCTHCCKAISNYDADSNESTPTEVCNGPVKTLAANAELDYKSGPLVYMCGNKADCTGWAASNAFGTDNSNWQLKNLPVFMKDHLEHSRVHPGEGRNSLPEDKFIMRMNQKPKLLDEQADKLSPEDTDFHDDRQYQTGNNAFGHGSSGKGLAGK